MARKTGKPRGKGDGKPGPKPRELGTKERSEFLGLIRAGFGIHMAVTHMKIGWARFKRTAEARPGFRRDVLHARAYLRQHRVYVINKRAFGDDDHDPDYDLMKFLVGRDDRNSQFVAGHTLKRAELELRRELAKLGLDPDSNLVDVRLMAKVVAEMKANADRDADAPPEPETGADAGAP